MGKSSAETVREIEDTRDRLDAEIRELEDRLPKPATWAKRAIGLAVGGGVGGAAFWFAVRRVRGRSKKKKQTQTAQAVINIVPEEWAGRVSKAFESGEWKGWAAGIGGVWVILRLAEIRQMRKLNRAVLAGR